MAKFYEGKLITSYEEVQSALRTYEDEHFVKFYARTTEIIETAMKRCMPRLKIKKDLKYTLIQYNCIYGGKQYF